jgi:indole-3-glycerol phosphate synthase
MTILDEILESTRHLVVRRKRERSASSLEAQGRDLASPLSLRDALHRESTGDRLAFICESKRRSPSKGVIRPDYDAARNADAYANSGADALSILTEPDFFGGSPDDLQAARAAAPETPILRKDFVVDAYQLYEARAWGADAVLLIAAALDASHLAELLYATRELGLSALVELHDESELDRVDFDLVEVAGVNNRDLRTFEVDVSRAPRVLGRLPRSIARVAESGLRDAQTLADLHRQGIDAVLIGETFMRAPDPGRALADLREQTHDLLSLDS